MRKGLTTAVASVVLLGLSSGTAWAAWAATGSIGSGSAKATSLAPAVLGSPTTGCKGGVLGILLGHPYVKVTWTPSTSSWSSGQDLLIASTAALLASATPVPLATAITSYTIEPAVPGTTYWFKVVSKAQLWRADSNADKVQAVTPALGLACIA